MTEKLQMTKDFRYDSEECTLPCGTEVQIDQDFAVNNEMQADLQLSDGVFNVVETITEINAQGALNHKKEASVVTLPFIEQVLNQMGINVADNEITGETEIEGMGNEYSKNKANEILPTLVRDKLAHMGIKTSRSWIKECITTIADRNRYNPARNMLINTVWDGVDRISELYKILGITESIDDSIDRKEKKKRYRNYIKKWLHQGVAILFNGTDEKEDPYGADGALILLGPQGIGKSRFFFVIVPDPSWHGEMQVLNITNKDNLIEALSKWIVELGEIDGTMKLQQAGLKTFLTKSMDEIRYHYGHKAKIMYRRTSFCGTVNKNKFLVDETGSRRFWVIKVEHIDLKMLERIDRNWTCQLWAQVYRTMYLPDKKHQGFRLTPEEREQLIIDNREFFITTNGEESLFDNLCWELPVEQWEYISMSELAEKLGGLNPAQTGRSVKKLMTTDSRILSKNAHGHKKLYLLPPVRDI